MDVFIFLILGSFCIMIIKKLPCFIKIEQFLERNVVSFFYIVGVFFCLCDVFTKRSLSLAGIGISLIALSYSFKFSIETDKTIDSISTQNEQILAELKEIKQENVDLRNQISELTETVNQLTQKRSLKERLASWLIKK